MSIYSVCWSCNPTTKVFGTPCLMSQEKAKIFRSKFHHFYGESSQEYRHKIIKGRTNKKREVLKMYSSKDGDVIGDVRTSKLDEYKHLVRAIYEFSRPYTTYGHILSITSISLLPLKSWAQVTPSFLVELLKAIIPLLLVHFYTVGINQIYDVEIDKVNKPLLPLASGAFSKNFAVGIVVTYLIMGLGLGIKFGSPASLSAVVFTALLGTLYSIDLPYMRWKRNPLLAAFCIIFTAVISSQLAYYIHIQKYVFGEPVILSRGIIFATTFTFLYTIIISIFKDIPDVDGDKLYDIKSFVINFGQERVFWLCIGVLMALYGGAMAIGIYSSSLFNKIVAVLGHFSLAFILLNKALKTDATNKESTQAFYMFIWKLFSAEYLLIPFMR